MPFFFLNISSGYARVDGGIREMTAGQSQAFLSKLASLFSQKDVSTGDGLLVDFWHPYIEVSKKCSCRFL